MVTKDTSADSLKCSTDKICLTISLSSDLRCKSMFIAPLEKSKGFLFFLVALVLLRGDAVEPFFSQAVSLVLRMEKREDQSYKTCCNQHVGLMPQCIVFGKIHCVP